MRWPVPICFLGRLLGLIILCGSHSYITIREQCSSNYPVSFPYTDRLADERDFVRISYQVSNVVALCGTEPVIREMTWCGNLHKEHIVRDIRIDGNKQASARSSWRVIRKRVKVVVAMYGATTYADLVHHQHQSIDRQLEVE